MLIPDRFFQEMHSSSYSPVAWSLEGEPYSPQFGDVYHTSSGALAQAEHVFLQGCRLPESWLQQKQFVILETGFGLGLNFLATWNAWRQTPGICKRLHFVSVEAYPVNASDIERATTNIPAFRKLGQRFAEAYPLLLPGMHRVEFDEGSAGQVTLTLVIGDARQMLPQLDLSADAIFLDGFSPAKNPELWGEDVCKMLARLSRPRTRIATWSVAGVVRRHLESAGFSVERRPGLPPKHEALTGYLQPRPRNRHRRSTQAGVVNTDSREVVVIGAGFAGAATCWSLARRGWQVRLIDRAPGPAHGASGLPMGMGLPHISPDDALLSQLTRAGAAWMRQLIKMCALDNAYWSDGSVEQVVENSVKSAIPSLWGTLGKTLFTSSQTDENQPCRHFHHGLRLEGPAFINALLANISGLVCQWNTDVTQLLQNDNGSWQLMDVNGQVCAQTPHVVVAAAMDSLRLCELANPAVTPNRGQITLGKPGAVLPPYPLEARTGNGHFLLPLRADAPWSWSMGSTFQHNCTITNTLPQSHQENLNKLRHLSPRMAHALKSQFELNALDAFVDIRCTTNDHMPMVGAVPDLPALAQLNARSLHSTECPVRPGLFILAALGSRGISAGAICAELLASMMCNEPWPVTRQVVQALMPARFILRQLRKNPDRNK